MCCVVHLDLQKKKCPVLARSIFEHVFNLKFKQLDSQRLNSLDTNVEYMQLV